MKTDRKFQMRIKEYEEFLKLKNNKSFFET